jgi:hypothetical protein
MMIVCTKDPAVVGWATNPDSGSEQWHAVAVIPPTSNQAQASRFLADTLATLDLNVNEPLCLFAHGNDDEIGDPGGGLNDWSWTTDAIAKLLQDRAPRYRGPILIQACADRISNFSAGLAVALGRLGALRGVWIYGYNRPVPIKKTFPAPASLGSQVDLQGTQVT